MKNADLIIQAGSIVTVNEANDVLPDHALVVADGLIVDITPNEQVQTKYTCNHILDRKSHLLMPGLINAHTHLAMNLLRGFADDLPLATWLGQHIWPTEGKWLSEEFVTIGTRLAIAESLLGGVTCVNDMYFFPDCTATEAESAGIRAALGLITMDMPTVWAQDVAEYLAKGLALHDRVKDNALITTVFAPHAPYTVSQESLQRIATLAAELDLGIHMHVHETAQEVEDYVAIHGRRPIAALDEMGLLSPALLAVHMSQLEPDEIERISETGVQILHCPESNMKLASGACPVGLLLDRGVNVALGTDGAASNNDLDMFGEMRTAALLAKHVSGDASCLSAQTALRMGTINGAVALGLADTTGSLEIGKSADCITVDIDSVEMQPIYSAESHLVYCTDRSKVTDVWVRGTQLVNGRELTTLDQSAIISSVNQWATRIISA